MFEGAIEFQLIVENPAGCEMDRGEPLIIVEALGDGLNFLQDPKG